MKALILLPALLLPLAIACCAQDFPSQDPKIGVLEVIWKIKIEPTVDPEAPQPSKRIAYNVYLPDKMLNKKKSQLDLSCNAIIMTMTELGAIDSTATETVRLDLYSRSGTVPITSAIISVRQVLAKYKTMSEKIRGLFVLFPYPRKIKIRKKQVDGHFYAPDSLYKPGADYGYISLTNSIIITKYFARSTGQAPLINFMWEDPTHQKNIQSFSTNDPFYQLYEKSFLQTKTN